ncbi:nuclear transport factor 2 family protein [Nocardioides endophyticus]|uniref:Nuclear transport factor 2 family protein n=1 Tax=Nocardioides endophyticus TaxID=1353775 RepID=A0ABP8YRE0_9ACTN
MTTPTERIQDYFALATQSDMEPYFAQFAPDVVVEDDGQTHVGIDAVRAWRRSVPGVAYDVRAVADTSTGSHVATTEISGDFPGSPVLLGFVFTFDDQGLISRLVIAP